MTKEITDKKNADKIVGRETILTTKDLRKVYQVGKFSYEAVKNVSIEIPAHQFSVFIGPSGCGKTTMLNMFGTIDEPTSGNLVVAEREVLKMKDSELANFRAQEIGFIFQTFNLIPVFSVFDNVAYPLRLCGMDRKEVDDRVVDILKKVNMESFIHKKPNELSGGQRQRISIARALVNKPSLVLADEPTANLDSKTSEKILELMVDLCHTSKVTFIFVTHDPIIVDYSDWVYRMKDGEILSVESPRKKR